MEDMSDTSGADPEAIPLSLLRQAVDEGIITEEQLLRLIARATAPHTPSERAAPASPPPIAAVPPVAEVRHGFNAVTVAYYAGALAVLFALGWFLAERWHVLGPGGVLLVAAIYAAIFLAAGRLLTRRGFHFAASLTWLLVVATTPLVAWALLALAGLWYEAPIPRTPELMRDIVYRESLRWIPVDLATLVVSVVALWRMRAALLVLPVAIAVCYLTGHLVPLFFDPALAPMIVPSMLLFVGSLLLLAGDAAERWQPPPREDYATSLYLVGLAASAIGIVDLWGTHPHTAPHIVGVISILLIAASLYLRRRVFLVFGAIGLVAYLAYLAFDLFRETLGFPIVLATFGIALILLAVWIQRRYPALARRIASRQGGGRPTLPGGYYFFALAAIVTFILLVEAPGRIRRRQERQEAQQRQYQERLRARQDSLRSVVGDSARARR